MTSGRPRRTIIDQDAARAILEAEAAAAVRGDAVPAEWVKIVERLSEECERVDARTHIAFLGTALLAKATNLNVDVFALKANAGTPGAYTARTLAQFVLVPAAVHHDIHLGVTGREPLNNQPYFRLSRVSRDELRKIVRKDALDAALFVVEALERLAKVRDEPTARAALRAFLKVRHKKVTYPTAPTSRPRIDVRRLGTKVIALVSAHGDGGRSAQAVAAGLMDAFLGSPERVFVGRINDPDRNMPGDVGVRRVDGTWERLLEVRDKAVRAEDALLFARKLAENGVTRGGVVAVAEGQKPFNAAEVLDWAAARGVHLSMFFGWPVFIGQGAFWAGNQPQSVADTAYDAIRRRLIAAEVPAAAIALWDEPDGANP